MRAFDFAGLILLPSSVRPSPPSARPQSPPPPPLSRERAAVRATTRALTHRPSLLLRLVHCASCDEILLLFLPSPLFPPLPPLPPPRPTPWPPPPHTLLAITARTLTTSRLRTRYALGVGKKAADNPNRPHDSAGPARHSHPNPILPPPPRPCPKTATDDNRALDTPSHPPSTYRRDAAATVCVRLCVCMYVCMYICMYVCMCVRVCVYAYVIYTSLFSI